MAPIKFEENIKNKLDERRLKPSSEAWSKLSERLDGQGKKGNNMPFWWMGIAASIVGGLFIVSQFVNDESIQEITPQTVDTPKVETLIEQESKISTTDEDVIKKAEIEDAKFTKELEVKKLKSTVAIAQEGIVTEDKVIIKENVTPELKSETNKPIAVVLEKLTFEEETIQNVVAKIQELKDDSEEVTDEAIDALLLQAQKEITIKKLYNDSTRVVDADLLLQDVEADLDQSFRTKVFETLKASYNTVKTAVAQRND